MPLSDADADLPSAATVLEQASRFMTVEQRVAMTISCDDASTIPKVVDAGSFDVLGDQPVQIMHNGLRVVRGGYYGDWMAEIISALDGHHEPQEELVFHHIVERIDHPRPTMIELGCFWAYYSLWFLKLFPEGLAISAEPDPDHLAIGRRNAELNGLSPRFHQAAAGPPEVGLITLSSEIHPGVEHIVPVRSVPDLMESEQIDRLDLLHLDIQGFELAAMQTAEELIRRKSIRFVVVSTHHHLISQDALTHERCLEWLVSLGAHVIAEHSVAESFSGDGLIAVSFDERDEGFTVPISHNRSSTSLFQPSERDLAVLIDAYDGLVRRYSRD